MAVVMAVSASSALPFDAGVGDRGSDGLRRAGVGAEHAGRAAAVRTDREGGRSLQIDSGAGRVELGMHAERRHGAR